jgi:aminopeptidase N
LILLNRSSAPERLELLAKTYQDWHEHLSGYANYLRVVAAGTNPDVFEMIEQEAARPTFDVNQPTGCRALLLTMAVNTKMVWTDQGIDWVAGRVVWLSPINDMTASRLLNTFQHFRRLKPELQARVKPALERIIRDVPADVSPTVHAQAEAYLGEG